MKSPLPLTLFLLPLLLIASSSASAQSWSSEINQRTHMFTFGTNAPRESSPVITGSPFSFEESSDHSQVLADGTRIALKTFTMVLYRDSAGRTRTERPIFLGNFPGAPLALHNIKVIEITDPVAGVQYVLDTQNRVAYRFPFKAFEPPASPRVPAGDATSPGMRGSGPTSLAAPSQAKPLSGAPVDPQRPQVSAESLGTEVMEGVYVEGRRTTTVFPTGSEGNDRPITRTCEEWFAPDLGRMVFYKCADPRGDNVTHLTNIDRSEPDPSLFQVPQGYSIVDGHGRISIQFRLPQR